MRSISISFFIALLLFGCKSDDPKPLRTVDFVLARMGGSWKIKTANLNGVEKTEFKDAGVVFGGSQSDELIHFVTGNMPPDSPWAATGTIKIGTDPLSGLILVSPETEMTYTVNGTQLQIVFIWKQAPPDDGNVHTNYVGSWTFVFDKVDSGPTRSV